jgi:1-acyl-sn-glycerol-3-phosphate acyltransferase
MAGMSRTANSRYDLRTRPRPFTFYPPKTSPFWIGVAKLGIRRVIRRQLRVTEVEINDEDLDRLKKLKGQRCLLTPSHSGGMEPHIIMYLSKLVDDTYNYVAAVEVFEQAPINRWLMPRLGVYSIMRGAVDRPSFAMTRQILAEGKRWLVIFPEGHAILQNSTLAPFQEGVIQLAFKGFDDARASNATASLFCIPIAIRYVYLADMHPEIDRSLDRLATAVAIPKNGKPASRYERIRQIAEAVLGSNEKMHGVKVAAGSPLNDRIQNLKAFVAAQIERQLGIVPTERQSLLERVRALFNAVDRIVHDEPPVSDYEQRLALERQQLVRVLYEDLWRLLQFVAIYDGYVRESMTVERFMDVLGLLELEIFKKRRIWGPRKACVKVALPIDLKDYVAAYEANKREAIQDVNTRLESAVRENLDAMEAKCALVRG